MKDRLERLERENLRIRERLHRLEALLGAGEGQVAGELSARSFAVRDAEGRLRASLALSEFGPELQLFDTRGALRARLGLVWEEEPEREHGPGLTFFDAAGEPLVSLVLGLDGEGRLGPVLTMSVPGVHPARLVMGASRHGPLLSMHDHGGFARLQARLDDAQSGEPELLLRPNRGGEWRAGE